MSRFLLPLVVRKHSEPKTLFGRAKWQLVASLPYQSSLAGDIITVPCGFIMDFASVPRLCMLFALFGDVGHKAATVHDYLCRRKMVSRATADKIYLEALEEEGVPAWRRHAMYAGVRVGAAIAWLKVHLAYV